MSEAKKCAKPEGAPRFVYVTKYALSDGIVRCQVDDERTMYCNGRGCYVKWYNGLNGVLSLREGEYAETLDAAQEQVRKAARAKLRSIDKQRAKLEAIVRDGAKVKEER